MNNTATNPNDINVFRKKKKRRFLWIKLTVLALILAGAAVIFLNADTIFEPLRGIASKIDTTTTTSVGFPVKLPGSASYSFNAFGEDFLLLTDTYLYTYHTTGQQIYALQHGYTNPFQQANEKRILLYDKNSFEVSLYNKSSRIYELTMDDKVVSAYLGKTDCAAVITTSSRYSDILYVYDGNGKWKFIKKYIDENVMQVAFSSDDRNIAVTTIGTVGGDICCKVYYYSLNAEEPLWEYTVSGNTIPFRLEVCGDYIEMLGDNKLLSISALDGTVSGSYSFTSTILNEVLQEGFSAILLRDQFSNDIILIVTDNAGNVTTSGAMPVNTADIESDGEYIYILGGNRILCYDTELNLVGETETGEEYSDLVKIGGYGYLLGYDEVQSVALD